MVEEIGGFMRDLAVIAVFRSEDELRGLLANFFPMRSTPPARSAAVYDVAGSAVCRFAMIVLRSSRVIRDVGHSTARSARARKCCAITGA